MFSLSMAEWAVFGAALVFVAFIGCLLRSSFSLRDIAISYAVGGTLLAAFGATLAQAKPQSTAIDYFALGIGLVFVGALVYTAHCTKSEFFAHKAERNDCN